MPEPLTAIHGQALPPLPASAYPPHALPIPTARRSLRRWLLDRVIPATSVEDWHRW